MIGKLVMDSTDVVALADDGTWSALAPEYERTADLLNATEHPGRDRRGGDHHLPFGVMALNRAAEKLGATVALDKPIPPLPDGAIS